MSKPLIGRSDIIFKQEEEESFLFEPESGKLFVLNTTGVEIWKLCEEGKYTEENIIEKLKEKFGDQVSIDKLQEDCHKFIEKMKEEGLISYVE